MATTRTRSLLAAAAAGVCGVAFGAGLGEATAAIAVPESSPFAVVGGALIDAAPPWAKDLAIELFGLADKVALLIGIAIVMGLVAAGAGVLESRRPPWGSVIAAALGVVGIVVATSRAGASGFAWLPAAVAGAAAAIAMRMLVRLAVRAYPPQTAVPALGDAGSPDGRAGEASGAPEPSPAAPSSRGVDRRGFLAWSGAAAAVGMIGLVVGNVARAGVQAATTVRDALRLPSPARSAPPIPAGAELGIPDLAPVVTPNGIFYRIDTALVAPQIDPADWSLRIHGMVDREVSLTWDELLALPLEETDTTLTCVSNTVGGGLIGNARWLGYPIRNLLEKAGVSPDADMVLSRSIDGWTASTPLEALTDDRDSILAVGMNGEPLPVEHGFPVRMVVPGLYGYVSATKWVTELKVTRFDSDTAYWTTRGWSARGPIKLQSRIDVPRFGTRLAPGDTVIAGMAWQQHVGVAGVEVQIDGGEWMPATLATAISDDTWVQWSIPWTATAGRHEVRCRAISATGEVQTDDAAPPAPDGATGRHRIDVTVE
ncbi:molybdopterin-dependent oxidoreductase [Microbacter sp. GSS18]|nr:molybdopterin-dependent oxidoreductase [Microbacter sp. GSS18]